MAGDLFRRPDAARRARRLLIDAGVVLISAAGSAIISHTALPSGAWACALVAFLLFLLGVWMAMLALVAGRFPGAARIAVAIARALHRYMFGRER
ncbi:unnamed protein product [Urochloa decumbens]|uniref:Uncharacterized protein n=1 Tax=Urochloa decumbens TaxID=240449 RepID=A0ABC8ZS42_9POAL